MKKCLVSLFGFFLVLTFSCQNKSENKPDKDSPEGLLPFILPDYTLLDTARGDLNQDGIQDLIIVLSKNTEQETPDSLDNPEKRPLLLLLGQKDNTYKEAKRNDNAVYCFTCGGMLGDPYQKISIKDGQFSIEHFGGSSWKWARTISFRYISSEDDWYLTEDAVVSFHGSDPDEIESKILSPKDFGEVKFDAFDINKE